MVIDTLKFHCYTFRVLNMFFKKKKKIHILTQLRLLGFCLAQKFIHLKSRVNKLTCQPEGKHQKDVLTPQPPDQLESVESTN